MKPTIILLILTSAIFVPQIKSYGHGNDGTTEPVNTARFSENKGQWDENVLYRLNFTTGVVFFEKDRLTYSFFNQDDWEQIYHDHNSDHTEQTGKIRGHAFNVHFENCNPQLTSAGFESFENYENYYIGNNPAKWASNVSVYRQIRYQNLYPGIDLQYETSEGHLKYSYIVKPHSNPNQIKMRFEGVEGIYIQDGNLHCTTSVNSIQEQHLYAWQNINGQRIEIPCTFVLSDSTVSFRLARRYNPNYELVIDPVLVFSTYTGSTADNFGFTATYDNTGHLYAGGIVFGQGYPLTTGAYDALYNGGNVDVSITKFTPDGSALVYSTFLGGVESENPSSIVVNDQNELIVLGTTSSSDFPTTAGAYDRTFNSGVGKNYPNNGPNFVSGTDIFVCKFNAAGSALVGSTYIGGSDNDGLNDNNLPGQYGVLVYNYGDQFRGEVVIDASGNIYAVSSTLSTNFPTTAGVFRPNSGGGQDAVVFKFNSSLTSLNWSSYLGGSGTDAGYNIVTDNQNRVYVSGGTTSTNFPTTAGSLNTTYRGGRSDGYIVLISAGGNTILNGTYIGTSEYDQSYFIDQDAGGNIYVVGQTDGAYPVTSGVYTNTNSGQYLSALTSNLSAIVFSTIFGRGDGDPDISPTAFLVDNCNNIYISGWAGQTLMDIVNFGAFTSTVQGMPITSDAYQNTPDLTGSDFYFIVFGRNATSLQYGSFFGSPSARDHVDGGTSRFDKNGIIYQAVCAGCGGYDDFPYTPGAWSQNNASFNCNEGLAKFEFQLIGVDVDVLASPSVSGCTPLTVSFDGQPVNVIDFNWNFGDGTTSSLANPSHTFANPGVYDVRLIGIDSTTCAGLVFSDTSTVRITVFANPVANAGQDVSICSGQNAQLTATGGGTYRWNTNQTTQSINVSPVSTTTYSVTVTNVNSCTATDNVTVQVKNSISVQQNASICNGDSLFVGGDFQTGAGLYVDTLVAANGCDSIISTNLFVLADTSITLDVAICDGDSFLAGGRYQTSSGQYFDTLIASDGCDSVIITNLLVLPNAETTIDAEICDGDGYFAGGTFQTTSGIYYDTMVAANGCDSIVITNLTVNPNLITNVDVTICNEDFYFVGGANQNTSGIYYDTLLTSKGCDSVIVTNLTVLPLPVTTIDAEICDGDGFFAGGDFQTISGTYFDTLTNANGCDSIIITNLTVNPNVVTNVDVTICNEDFYFVGGGNQNTSGIYYDTLLTSKGCDSVIVTNLTVLPLPVTTIDAEICDGDGFFAGGDFQTISGTYFDTVADVNGCDSIIITNLIVNPNVVTNVDVTICNEDFYFVGGGNQNTSGIYFDTLSTAKSCDSVIVTSLTVRPQLVTVIDAEICDSDEYFAAGDFQTTSGTYFDTLTDANGCDSIIITNLTVNPNVVTNVDVTICNEDFYFVGGGNQNTSGIYFDTLSTAKGCDSVIVTNLTVRPLPVTTIDAEICDGDGYFAAGDFQTTSGTYFDTLIDANGCDSIIITNLTINPNVVTNVDVTICNEDFYFVGGGNQNTSGIYFDTLSTAKGCDSVLVTNLTVLPLPVTTIDAEICDGDSYFVGGDFQTTSGTYFDTLTDANGCDSIIITNLIIGASLEVDFQVKNITCNCAPRVSDGGGNGSLSCALNISSLQHGTILADQLASQGVTVTGVSNDPAHYPNAVAIFNSDLSNTAHDDLEVGIGNLLILPNDLTDNNQDGFIDNPNDSRAGGTMTFTFDRDRTVISITLADNDRNGTVIKAYDLNNNLLMTMPAPQPNLPGTRHFETYTLNISGVRKLTVSYVYKMGVTGLILDCLPPPCGLLDISALVHGETVTNQLNNQGVTITGVSNDPAHYPNAVAIFNSDLSNTAHDDLEVGIGNLLILPNDLTDNNHDGFIDNPNDSRAGGTMTFSFDHDRTVISIMLADNDRSGTVINAYDSNNNLLLSLPAPPPNLPGARHFETYTLNISGVRKLTVSYNYKMGVAGLILDCPQPCCDGNATANASGGFPPYQYSWSNGSSTAFSGDSLCAGTYYITVTDANNCTFTDSVTIEDFQEIEISITVEDISENCSASANQLCELNFNDLPAGERLNEQYAQYGIHISGDAYGNFTDQIIIFDADATGTPDPDLEPATGHLAIFPENLTDNNSNGLVDAPNDQGQGGKMTFTFDQDMEVISFVFVDKERNNAGTANAYDANNTLIKTVSIPNAGDGSVQTIMVNAAGVRKLVIDYRDSGGVTEFLFGCEPMCCDGSASASVSGGNPPYTYQWSNGATSSFIDSLCPGIYSVTVTDEDSCQSTQTIDIFNCSLSISGMTIVRPQLGGDVAPLTDGMSISLDTLCQFNIRADLCHSPNGSARFLLNGEQFSIENNEPYALAGDNPIGSYYPWTPAPGDYTLVATPYSGPNASGEEGRRLTIEFSVVGHPCALKTLVNDIEETGFNLKVYPVPFEEIFMIDLEVAKSVDGTLRVLDVIGRELIKQSVDLFSGVNTFTIPLGSQTPEGIYFLEVRVNGQVKVMKVIKG